MSNSEDLCDIEGLRELCALMALDCALWDTEGVRVETAYVQQALRLLTKAIEGEIGFNDAYDTLKEMQP